MHLKSMTLSILLLALFLPMVSFSATYEVNFDPNPSEIAKNLRNKAKGTVHIFPCAKGESIKVLENGMIDLDPIHLGNARSESHSYTKPELLVAITARLADTLRQAGYTVTEGKEVPPDADITVGLQLTRALAGLNYGLAIPGGPPETNNQQIIVQETDWPHALLWVTAELKNKAGKHISFLMPGKDDSMIRGMSGSGIGLSRAMNGALEKLQTDFLYTILYFQAQPKVVEAQAALRKKTAEDYITKENETWIKAGATK